MTASNFAVVFVALVLIVPTCNTSKVVFFAPISSKSHNNVYAPVIKGLAARGHEVTVFTSLDFKSELPNLKYITIPGFREYISEMQPMLFEDAKNGPSLSNLVNILPVLETVCENMMNNEEMKSLLKKGKTFDLAIVSEFFNECGLVAGTLLGKHTVFISPAGQMPFFTSQLPSPPSYVSSFFASKQLSFTERAINGAISMLLPLVTRYVFHTVTNKVIQKHIPGAPTIQEANERVCFTILNSDPVFESPRPGMPNVVKVGGMHLRKARPLPKDLEDFVNSSGDEGFIIFGLGSSAQSQYMPNELKVAFLEAFGRLKQKVIWKFEDASLPNQPSNLKIIKWMPQQDLLGHPKVKAFITHGGLLSLEEAVYHAVPVIGIPLFADQPTNVKRAEAMEIGLSLEFNNVTADIIYEKVQTILSDSSYKENMKKMSAAIKDELDKPLDRALFWLEYVIRHDGAPHLRSPGEALNFFQYFLLDVIGVIALGTIIVLFVLLKSVKFAAKKLGLCRSCTYKDKKKVH